MEERTVIDPGFGPAPGGEATRVIDPGYGAPAMGYDDRTQQAMTTTCPVCGTPNPPSERYCQDCGLMFGSITGEVEALPDVSETPRLTDPTTGRDFVLNVGVNSVGRENADILLADPTVSRRHAQVTLENGQVIVEDLGSTNGSYVAGQPVRAGDRAVAGTGDAVRFGSVNLTLSIPGGLARVTAPVAAPAAEVEAAPAEDRGAPVGQLVFPDGTEQAIYTGVNTLGRRSGNQIVLQDAFASGKHGEIRVEPDGTAQYVDVGSTNGSFMAGQRLAANTPLALADGQALTLGKTEVTFRAVASAPGEPGAEAPAGEPQVEAAYLGDFDVPGGTEAAGEGGTADETPA